MFYIICLLLQLHSVNISLREGEIYPSDRDIFGFHGLFGMFATNEKDCLRYPDSPSTPRIYDFPIGPTYLLSRLHDSLDTFRGYLELSPPDLASGFFSCRFPAAPIGASGCT